MTNAQHGASAWLRDPLFHFALLGVALFALYLTLNRGPGEDDRSIVVSNRQQAQLAAAFERVWRRPPTEQEFKGLVDDWLREELANREAEAMGLGEDDPIIRRRLRQKFEAFADQIALAPEPDDATLDAWYQQRLNNYRRQARYSFKQLFFSSERRADAAADARQVLALLGATDGNAGTGLGDGLALPQTVDDQRAAAVAAAFGDVFLEGLGGLEQGRWAGPITSAFGEHLVFVERVVPGQQPPLAEVREAVLRDWREDQRQEGRAAIYDELLARYDIVVEPPEEEQAVAAAP